MGMSKPVKVPTPIHEDLKELADERDVPMGAVVAEWREDSKRLRELRENGHRLLDAEPSDAPGGVPRDDAGDPVFKDGDGNE